MHACTGQVRGDAWQAEQLCTPGMLHLGLQLAHDLEAGRPWSRLQDCMRNHKHAFGNTTASAGGARSRFAWLQQPPCPLTAAMKLRTRKEDL